MPVNLSSSLAGLSLIAGTNAFADQGSAAPIETKAVRAAKAQFTTPATTPPWALKAVSTPVSAQVSAIQAMKSIIDRPGTGADALPVDVQTSFTAYKALDRLRLLAEAATPATTTPGQRAALQASFGKGLADLQTYLAQAPASAVELDFAIPSRRAESVKIAAPPAYQVTAPGIATARDAPLAGLTGTERFTITLSKPGASDTVSVDLSHGPQPPTLDSVASAFNAAIAAVPLRNPDGSVVLDANGQPSPRWLTHFVPDKSTDKWGFKISSPSGIEQASIEQVDAPDALMVATGGTAAGAAAATRVIRIDSPDGAMDPMTGALISATDRLATARAALLPAAPTATVKGVAPPSKTVAAPADARAIATDAAGFSYVVGTTGGDLGSHLAAGPQDLFLTKLDSEGHMVWQRGLGAAGSAQGAAVSIAPDGGILVAGTVSGSFDGAATDGDMLVARFAANGDQAFATVIRAAGADRANALAVASDGSIYVGGRSAGNQATIARLDANGTLLERRTIDGQGSLTALAVDGGGNLVALLDRSGTAQVRRIAGGALATDLGSIDLGTADARALAISGDGGIAVGGAASAALAGDQVNAASGGRDGFVTRIAADLGSASTTYLGTSADDQVDSIAFLGGALYAGGRTTGALGGALKGSVDGFVARLDAGDGTVSSVSQFGQSALRTEPVRIAAAAGGDSVLGALGLHRGALIPRASPLLTTQTSLRAGDEFSIAVDGAAAKKVTIRADDTLSSLAGRIRQITGTHATVTTPTIAGSATLRIDAKSGSPVELTAGAPGKDALAKLGIAPERLTVPPIAASGAPRVQPGGTYGLVLSTAMNLTTAADATAALGRLKAAISTTKTAYRSLYWDDSKAALANGTTSTATDPVIAGQMANYQAALDRLSTTNPLVGF